MISILDPEYILMRQAAKHLTKEVMKYIASKYAFLSTGIIGYFMSGYVTKVLIIALTQTKLGFAILAIDRRTENEKNDFKKAIEKKSKAKSQQEIIAAELEIEDAARKFIKF